MVKDQQYIKLSYKNGTSINIDVPIDYYKKKYPKKSRQSLDKIFMKDYTAFVKALNNHSTIALQVGKYFKFSKATIFSRDLLSVDIKKYTFEDTQLQQQPQLIKDDISKVEDIKKETTETTPSQTIVEKEETTTIKPFFEDIKIDTIIENDDAGDVKMAHSCNCTCCSSDKVEKVYLDLEGTRLDTLLSKLEDLKAIENIDKLVQKITTFLNKSDIEFTIKVGKKKSNSPSTTVKKKVVSTTAPTSSTTIVTPLTTTPDVEYAEKVEELHKIKNDVAKEVTSTTVLGEDKG